MIESGNQVLLRMTTAEANRWDCVCRFVRSKSKDAVVELVLPARSGHGEAPLTVNVHLVEEWIATTLGWLQMRG